MPPSQLWRTVINVDQQVVERHTVVIPGINLEYPRVDERYPHVVYAPCSLIKSSGLSDPTTGFCQIDTTKDSVQYWWAPPKLFCGELVPVPKRDSNGNEVPGGGSWLLGLVHDALRKRVSLGVLDSERFQEGPVCLIHLKHALTWGLHCSFTKA
jgi:carotenoid cleavage dioxygenase-like enzyme